MLLQHRKVVNLDPGCDEFRHLATACDAPSTSRGVIAATPAMRTALDVLTDSIEAGQPGEHTYPGQVIKDIENWTNKRLEEIRISLNRPEIMSRCEPQSRQLKLACIAAEQQRRASKSKGWLDQVLAAVTCF